MRQRRRLMLTSALALLLLVAPTANALPLPEDWPPLPPRNPVRGEDDPRVQFLELPCEGAEVLLETAPVTESVMVVIARCVCFESREQAAGFWDRFYNPESDLESAMYSHFLPDSHTVQGRVDLASGGSDEETKAEVEYYCYSPAQAREYWRAMTEAQ